MLKWKEYRTQLLGRIGELPKLAPDTIKTAIRRWPGRVGRPTISIPNSDN